jgi:hypothetical protein
MKIPAFFGIKHNNSVSFFDFQGGVGKYNFLQTVYVPFLLVLDERENATGAPEYA